MKYVGTLNLPMLQANNSHGFLSFPQCFFANDTEQTHFLSAAWQKESFPLPLWWKYSPLMLCSNTAVKAEHWGKLAWRGVISCSLPAATHLWLSHCLMILVKLHQKRCCKWVVHVGLLPLNGLGSSYAARKISRKQFWQHASDTAMIGR